MRMIAPSAGVHPVADASENLLVAPRSGAAGSGFIAVELENRPAHLTLPRRMTDLLTGHVHEARVDLPAYGVAVFSD